MQGWIKKILLVAVLIAVIVGSFWVSFMLGKQILIPAKKLPPSLTPPQIKTPEPKTPNISIEVETSGTPAPIQEIAKPAPKATPKITPKAEPKVQTKTLGAYYVQAGAFKSQQNAADQTARLKARGFDAYVSKSGSFYRVIAGNFSTKSSANELVNSLKSSGFDAVAR